LEIVMSAKIFERAVLNDRNVLHFPIDGRYGNRFCGKKDRSLDEGTEFG
jgi:hypothetical protein